VTAAAMMGAVRMRTILLGVLACVIATSMAPSARASVFPPRPAYSWVLDATLIVMGRVESVGTDKATMRVVKTLAGHADSETIEFTPVTHPKCTSGGSLHEPNPADVATGDEVALFLVQGTGTTFEVLDNGYAKVGIVELGKQNVLDRASLEAVERLVSVMKTADQIGRAHV